MTPTPKQPKSYNGFTIPRQPDTNLGLAIMIAEDDEGNSQPINVVSTINEAKEMAGGEMRERMRKLICGEDGGFCPLRYKVWARGVDGEYLIAASVEL